MLVYVRGFEYSNLDMYHSYQIFSLKRFFFFDFSSSVLIIKTIAQAHKCFIPFLSPMNFGASFASYLYVLYYFRPHQNGGPLASFKITILNLNMNLKLNLKFHFNLNLALNLKLVLNLSLALNCC